MQNTDSERLHGLDGLRAFSVVFVLLSHFEAWRTFPFDSPLRTLLSRIGVGGVDVFFVISGLLITHLILLEERRFGRLNLGLFYARRFVRIVPAAYVYIGFLIALATAGVIEIREADIGASLLFVKDFFAHTSWYTAHLWSLAIEEQFYLLWPLFLVAVRSSRRRLLVVVGLLCCAPIYRVLYYKFVGAPEGLLSTWRIDMHASGILAGCLLALAREQGWSRRKQLLHPLVPLTATLALLAIWSEVIPLGTTLRRLVHLRESAVAGAIAVVVNFVIESPRSALVRLLDSRLPALIGRMSFSIYLWQQFFCGEAYSEWIEGVPDTWYRRFPSNLALTIAAASGSYLLIERPLLRVRANLRPKAVFPIGCR